MPVLATPIALIVVAYLPGSQSGSTPLGCSRGVDAREQGSRKAGGTNAWRAYGKRVRTLRWRS